MSVNFQLGRRQCIPIIYTRGTHYDVGFDVGRTFSNIIQDAVRESAFLNNILLPAYKTEEGQEAYQKTLEVVRNEFPQYLREIEGTADGARVAFMKLFLFHMDFLLAKAADANDAIGCSTVGVNTADQQILGHSEDARSDFLNYFYIVSAHIVTNEPQGKWGVKEERFTSLCYAGHLPGYTMNFNHHGLISTVNTLWADKLVPGKMPRHFIARALLAAQNYEEAERIIRDPGCGVADGCSINITFLDQQGDRVLYNFEIGPNYERNESSVDIQKIIPGEHLIHCNKYLRLDIGEKFYYKQSLKSSLMRLETLKAYPIPTSRNDVVQMLGDQSREDNNVFVEDEMMKTIAVGIFDCKSRTFSLYSDNPRNNPPLIILPILTKEQFQ